MSKYKAVRTNGFASKKEAARYQELCLLQKAGHISDLKTQVRYQIYVHDELICAYVADFEYVEHGRFSLVVVEDCKGFRTPIYKLKKKLMAAVHRIEIRET